MIQTAPFSSKPIYLTPTQRAPSNPPRPAYRKFLTTAYHLRATISTATIFDTEEVL